MMPFALFAEGIDVALREVSVVMGNTPCRKVGEVPLAHGEAAARLWECIRDWRWPAGR
jgi:hypothetical protein